MHDKIAQKENEIQIWMKKYETVKSNEDGIIRDYDSKIQSKDDELKKLRDDVLKFQLERDKLEKENQHEFNKNQVLQERLDRFEREGNGLEQANKKIQKLEKELMHEQMERVDENELSRTASIQTDKIIAGLKEDIINITEKHLEESDGFSKTISSQDLQIQQLTKEKNEQMEFNERLEKLLEETNEEKSHITEENTRLSADNTKLKAELLNGNDVKVLELQTELQNHEEKLNLWRSRAKEFRQKHAEEKQKVIDLENTLKTVKSVLNKISIKNQL